MPTPLPNDYYYSQPFPKPGKLSVVWDTDANRPRKALGQMLAPGYYDLATMPIGDNMVVARGGAFQQVRLNNWGCLSVMPRFPVNEPSPGFLITLRGPYAASGTPEASRGEWKINSIGDKVYGRCSAPVYTHAGARFDRYMYNGYHWVGEGNYPPLSWGYWGGEGAGALGAMNVASTHFIEIAPSQTAPDVTIISNVKNVPVFASIAFVNHDGEETEKSDPVEVGVIEGWGENAGTVVNVNRGYDLPYGCPGVYVYAGYSPSTMTRQPVLDYQGSEDKYLWPWHLEQYPIHTIQDGPVACPSEVVQSILSHPQKQLESNVERVVFLEDNYDLYCPFVLPYSPKSPSGVLSRIVGDPTRRITFTQKTGEGRMTEYPLCAFNNHDDTIINLSFEGEESPWGVVAGGQAYGNTFVGCGFAAKGEDSYGFLADERACVAAGAHTQSESRFINCGFAATIPIKIEGNQTAKVRFKDFTSVWSSGNTRYLGDTAGIVYCCTSNNVQIDVRGVDGIFSTLVVAGGNNGPPVITITDVFVDAGSWNYITFSGVVGGEVTFKGGDRINLPLTQSWARSVVAPVAFNAKATFEGIRMDTRTNAVSFLLNQLTVSSDMPMRSVMPDEFFWASKGMPMVTDQGFDFAREVSVPVVIPPSAVHDS